MRLKLTGPGCVSLLARAGRLSTSSSCMLSGRVVVAFCATVRASFGPTGCAGNAGQHLARYGLLGALSTARRRMPVSSALSAPWAASQQQQLVGPDAGRLLLDGGPPRARASSGRFLGGCHGGQNANGGEVVASICSACSIICVRRPCRPFLRSRRPRRKGGTIVGWRFSAAHLMASRPDRSLPCRSRVLISAMSATAPPSDAAMFCSSSIAVSPWPAARWLERQ